ncbi:hypothetical protein GO755_25885 [Spirosoma sp. HMF4905]|uniref:Baseplate protein J-like domain-containing protein n=1 Tax=Spirosoma arboris TaxID=2682092 RepID=A0A7K1SIF2_9BACT|nr:hypothetical protein [Spirosoma arboris]MVM33494.1 hypothetical protein [Spirosoma arboris]
MDCNQNIDPLKLVREGTSQEQRNSRALDPGYAPVNERTIAHGMVFAQAYARYLIYYNSSNAASGNWEQFFSNDVSLQLAVAAIADVTAYKTRVKEAFDFLNDNSHQTNEPDLKNYLGYLFGYAATLARQLDTLKENLPADVPLKSTLQNLIQNQLAPSFVRLIAYYKPNLKAAPNEDELDEATSLLVNSQPDFQLMGNPAIPFSTIYKNGLSTDWITDKSPNWTKFVEGIPAQAGVYGSGATVFEKINHIATHNLFTSVFDQFLKVFARIVAMAKTALNDTLTKRDDHEPHYTLFLAFLRLQEYARQETNTLTGRHLDFYCRDILHLREKPAEPSHAHLLLELAKQTDSFLVEKGELFKAGKDDQSKDVFFVNDADFVANQAVVTALKTVYRHTNEPVTGENANANKQVGRLYASPVANSQDGVGAALTSADGSWHPFFNKQYVDGALKAILMPKAEVGFALASPVLYLTGGYRKISLTFLLTEKRTFGGQVTVYLTTEKGWFSMPVDFATTDSQTATLSFVLEADVPAILPYNAELHGGDFQTAYPLVKVILNQQADQVYDYAELETAVVKSCTISVSVGLDENGNLNKPGLKALAVSNDFGPVDLSKPFQPFGPIPQQNSALLIGSKEVFQKPNPTIYLDLAWRKLPATLPTLAMAYLNKGEWAPLTNSVDIRTNPIQLTIPVNPPVTVDYSPDDFFSATTVGGFLRLSTNGDFGYKKWQTDLNAYLANLAAVAAAGASAALETANSTATAAATPEEKATVTSEILAKTGIFKLANLSDKLVNFSALQASTIPTTLPIAPEPPELASIRLGYSVTADPILLDSTTSKDKTGAKFYHLAPFGMAERHPALAANAPTTLLPSFSHAEAGVMNSHEGEFYIGVTNLMPPQNLALLIQVADGTADPNAEKPKNHLSWSYLSGNNWVAFPKEAVVDTTGEFVRSGIVTLSMPRDATAANSLLPTGMHWIRVAVVEKSEAVCRLIRVAAQALRVTFTDQGNDPAFPAKVLPAGTITKLDQPDAAVKKIDQPFPTFGGRGKEASQGFYTRVSERLRHKDRAIGLWDYERLVLEAFPQLYKVKCLNHTYYEPGIYKELAPGHVTLIAVPDQQIQNQRDPLKPYTSLGVLEEIHDFLSQRLSSFVKLHVKNPQFEGVRVRFRVKFYDGFDETFYKVRLQEAITRFLSPWAFASSGGPSFGGKVYKSLLINFVEEQSYVDYVTDFQLFHDINNLPGTEDQQEIEGSKAISILVSVPATYHTITVIQPAEDVPASDHCPCEA